MNQPDHLSGQLEPHRAGEHGSLQPDCLAVCAPGRGLTVELLFERIIIEPKHSSAPTPEVELISDQLYDMLIRAETSPIERLLLLSPHTLFSLENLQQSFDSQVAVLPMIGEGATNWHFPIKPRARDSKIEVFVHSCHPEPGSRAFATLMGTLGRAELLFPAGALPAEALGVLMGLRRTLIECRLSPPVDVGESRWLRLRICPSGLMAPVPPGKQGATKPASAQLSQILDLLGPDTVSDSFHDAMQNLSSVSDLGHYQDQFSAA